MVKAIKCVVVGDSGVGKTSLINSYLNKEFSTRRKISAAFASHQIETIVDSKAIRLSLWDTAGCDLYDRLRPLAYPQSDVAIICFSLMNPASFGNVKSKWYQEIILHCTPAQIILVGTKFDLRSNKDAVDALSTKSLQPVSVPQGIAMEKEIGAYKYIQCSAMAHSNVDVIFEEAIRSVLYPACVQHQVRGCLSCKQMKKQDHKACVIM